MVERLESRLVEVRLSLYGGAQHGGGLTQPLGVVLRRAAAQCQQGHGALGGAHHLALAAQQVSSCWRSSVKAGFFSHRSRALMSAAVSVARST